MGDRGTGVSNARYFRYDRRMDAIVLDGHLKSALSAVRSLGAAGMHVSVGAERATAMALHSRYAEERFIYPSPYTDQKAFIDALIREAMRRGGKPVVFAFSDATFLSLYAYRETLKDVVTITFPPEKSMEIAFDKAATYSLARVSGVPTIPTHMIETADEVRRLADTLTYPVVVKARRSVAWKEGVGIFGTASFVHDGGELEARFFACKHATGESPLIQTFIRGDEYGVEMLAHEGVPYAIVAHHRLRSLSPTGGAAVLKETLYDGVLKDTLVAHAQTLVEKLAWTGPIMVEFKVDQDSRTPYLMEINGRFWGSLPLSVFAGVDMPFLYYNYLTAHVMPSVVAKGKEGIVSVHRMGYFANLFSVLFSRSRMRPLLFPKRSSVVRDIFALRRHVLDDVWTWADPKPVFAEIIDLIKTKLLP